MNQIGAKSDQIDFFPFFTSETYILVMTKSQNTLERLVGQFKQLKRKHTMIYVIEYNYPSQLLVEHINNYLEKKRVRNLPVKLVYNGNIAYIDYDLKNIYFFSCHGDSGKTGWSI